MSTGRPNVSVGEQEENVRQLLRDRKLCTGCGEVKPYQDYHKASRSKDGLRSQCKACRSSYMRERSKRRKPQQTQYNKQYRQANKEKLDARSRAYRQANKQRLRELDKQRYEANRAEILAQKKVYNAANRERFSKRDAAYYQANRERIQQRQRDYYQQNKQMHLERNRQRRALLASASGSHTFEEVWQMYEDQGGLCAYCETPLNETFHIDHIQPLSQGGSDDWHNLAITCANCNVHKHTMALERFMERLYEQSA